MVLLIVMAMVIIMVVVIDITTAIAIIAGDGGCARAVRPSLILSVEVGIKTRIRRDGIPQTCPRSRPEVVWREAVTQVADCGGSAGGSSMVFLIALTEEGVCWA